MRRVSGGYAAGRSLIAVALALAMSGSAVVIAAPAAPDPAPGPAASATAVPAPAAVVRETGSWFAHGYTLDLRSDGTGMLAAWMGAYDGTRIQLRLIPAPGAATVAEVTRVETVGAGGLAADEQPGVGGLVTVAVGDPVRTAHVEWSSGPRRLTLDLCPTEGLDAAAMAALRCGA